jgi:PAS domain-containing protein
VTDKEIPSGEAAVVQKQAEEAVRESEERYRCILNTFPDDITNTENGQPSNGERFEVTVPTGVWRMNPDTNDVYRGNP